jgi:hypothetical protein
VGLGFTSLSKTNSTTFFDALVAAKPAILDEPVFSLYLEASDKSVVDLSNQKASALMATQTALVPTGLGPPTAPNRRRQLDGNNDFVVPLAAQSSQAAKIHEATVADEVAGVLLLGGIDKTQMAGDLTYVPLTYVSWQADCALV